MLRTNLSTRPFYNERLVHLVLGIVAVAGLAVLAGGALRIVDLSGRTTELTGRAERAENLGADLAARAAEIQRAIGPQVLQAVAAAAREANLLIDQRVFSWTDFFNRLESTLPPDVMMTEVRPDIEPGSIEVTMGVLGRRLGAINEFIGALEESGAFAEVLSLQEEITEDGMYRAVLRGRYLVGVPSAVDTGGAALPETPADAGTDNPARVDDTPTEDNLGTSVDAPEAPAADAADRDDPGAEVDPAPDPPAVPGAVT